MSEPGGYSAVEKLTAAHDIDQFDCGDEPLNRFLKRFAITNQKTGSATTYVVCKDGVVVGYYSLVVGAVEHEDAAVRVKKGMPGHPIPVMILARLAISKDIQRSGLGRALLKDALLRTVQAADIAGIRALLVHAKDEKAREWYKQFEFEDSPTDPLHLFLLMKDIKALLG